MLPTIIFGLALTFSIIFVLDVIDDFINKETSKEVFIYFIIVILLWSYYHYLMH